MVNYFDMIDVIHSPRLSERRKTVKNENYAYSEFRRVGYVRDVTERLQQQKLLIVPKYQLE